MVYREQKVVGEHCYEPEIVMFFDFEEALMKL